MSTAPARAPRPAARRSPLFLALGSAVLAGALLPGCSGPRFVVAAPESLGGPLRESLRDFPRREGRPELRLVPGRIASGSVDSETADVVLDRMRAAAEPLESRPGTPGRMLLADPLALAASPQDPSAFREFLDVLRTNPPCIAVPQERGDPDTQTVFECVTSLLPHDLHDRYVRPFPSSAAAAEAVVSGECPYAVVPRTAAVAAGLRMPLPLPPERYRPILIVGRAAEGPRSARRAEAFFRHVLSPAGSAPFERAGYVPLRQGVTR